MLYRIMQLLAPTGQLVSFIFHMVCLAFKHPPPKDMVLDQIFRIGVLSLPVVIFSGISTGMVLASHGYFMLEPMGMQNSVGIIVMKTITVEIAPALTSFMITGRSGAAVAAELGSMVISEQISAVKSMGIDPMWYLVLPRMVAGMIVTPMLTAFCSFGGMVGGFIVSVLLFGVSSHAFFDGIPQALSLFDLSGGLIKSSIFGALIFGICSNQGLRAKQGAKGVGQVTTTSVVHCYLVVLFINFVITLAMNTIGMYIR